MRRRELLGRWAFGGGSGLTEEAERGAEERALVWVFCGVRVEDPFEGFLGFGLFVAEIDECEHDVVGGGVAGGDGLGWGGGVFPCGGDADLVFEFEDDAFGGFFADPADFGEGGGVAADDVAFEVGDAHAAEDGEAHFGADAGDALHEEAEEVAFVVGGEAVEGLFLFADVEVDEEFDGLA